jgi:hypothetical protein
MSRHSRSSEKALSYDDRIKADACSDAKRWDAPCFCLFENRDSRDGQDVGKFLGRKSMTSHCDLVSER